MIRKIYLAGPMRGLPKFNIPAFDFAAAKLREQGFEVFNPADRDRAAGLDAEGASNGPTDIGKPVINGFDVREALAADLEYICKEADAIAVLPGWQNSMGAQAEVRAAAALGKTIIELGRDYWV
jgi:nucleoside 2-deoxyribosyltransferase